MNQSKGNMFKKIQLHFLCIMLIVPILGCNEQTSKTTETSNVQSYYFSENGKDYIISIPFVGSIDNITPVFLFLKYEFLDESKKEHFADLFRFRDGSFNVYISSFENGYQPISEKTRVSRNSIVYVDLNNTQLYPYNLPMELRNESALIEKAKEILRQHE